MGSIYLGHPGVDRHHPISILSYHTMKIHILSFPTFGLTYSVGDIVKPRNCIDPQHRIVLYLLTQFRCSSNQNRSFSWILLECHEWSGRVLIVGSQPSSSIVSLQWPPSGASLCSPNGHVPLSSLNGCVMVLLRLCLTTICGQITHMYIYTET